MQAILRHEEMFFILSVKMSLKGHN